MVSICIFLLDWFNLLDLWLRPMDWMTDVITNVWFSVVCISFSVTRRASSYSPASAFSSMSSIFVWAICVLLQFNIHLVTVSVFWQLGAQSVNRDNPSNLCSLTLRRWALSALFYNALQLPWIIEIMYDQTPIIARSSRWSGSIRLGWLSVHSLF